MPVESRLQTLSHSNIKQGWRPEYLKIGESATQSATHLQFIYDAYTLKDPDLINGVQWPKRRRNSYDDLTEEEAQNSVGQRQLYTFDDTADYPFKPNRIKQRKLDKKIFKVTDDLQTRSTAEKKKQKEWIPDVSLEVCPSPTTIKITTPFAKIPTFMGRPEAVEAYAKALPNRSTYRPRTKVNELKVEKNEDALEDQQQLGSKVDSYQSDEESYEEQIEEEAREVYESDEEVYQRDERDSESDAREDEESDVEVSQNNDERCERSSENDEVNPMSDMDTAASHSRKRNQRWEILKTKQLTQAEENAEDRLFRLALEDFIRQQLPPVNTTDLNDNELYSMTVDYVTRTCGHFIDDVLHSMVGRAEAIDSSDTYIYEHNDWRFMLHKLQQNGLPFEVLRKVEESLMRTTNTKETVLVDYKCRNKKLDDADAFLTDTEAYFKAAVRRAMDDITFNQHNLY